MMNYLKTQTKKISLDCIYNGKPSICEITQGGIDIVFKVGKMKKFDHLTSISVEGKKIFFQGLYYGSILRKIQIDIEKIKEATSIFKVRKLSQSKKYGAMYKDHSLTNLKVASKGEKIYEIYLNKRADLASRKMRSENAPRNAVIYAKVLTKP